jgi:DNA-binding transcriptional ArsR family regulator
MVEYQQIDSVFDALGDPTRRALLRRLRTGPATVSELARPFDVSFNAISKHVMVLERAGLVRRERVGREHHLSLNARPLGHAAKWLSDYQQFWESKLDRLEQAVRNRKPDPRGSS